MTQLGEDLDETIKTWTQSLVDRTLKADTDLQAKLCSKRGIFVKKRALGDEYGFVQVSTNISVRPAEDDVGVGADTATGDDGKEGKEGKDGDGARRGTDGSVGAAAVGEPGKDAADDDDDDDEEAEPPPPPPVMVRYNLAYTEGKMLAVDDLLSSEDTDFLVVFRSANAAASKLLGRELVEFPVEKGDEEEGGLEGEGGDWEGEGDDGYYDEDGNYVPGAGEAQEWGEGVAGGEGGVGGEGGDDADGYEKEGGEMDGVAMEGEVEGYEDDDSFVVPAGGAT